MTRKTQNYQSSGVRLNPLYTRAVEQDLPFTLEVVYALRRGENAITSIKQLSDRIDLDVATVTRVLYGGYVQFPVQIVLAIARVLNMNPIRALGLYLFKGERVDQAMKFFIAMQEQLVEATEEERLLAFSVVHKFLSLPAQDRTICLAMLDALGARAQQEKVTPSEESDLADTPSEM